MEEEHKVVSKKKKETDGIGKFFALGLAGFLVILVVVSVIVSVTAVKKLSQNSFVLGVNKVLNLSIAEINGGKIVIMIM